MGKRRAKKSRRANKRSPRATSNNEVANNATTREDVVRARVDPEIRLREAVAASHELVVTAKISRTVEIRTSNSNSQKRGITRARKGSVNLTAVETEIDAMHVVAEDAGVVVGVVTASRILKPEQIRVAATLNPLLIERVSVALQEAIQSNRSKDQTGLRSLTETGRLRLMAIDAPLQNRRVLDPKRVRRTADLIAETVITPCG